jgi:hypothetical protein
MCILEGSNIRRIVPDTQAELRGITNSNPSLDTSVTNSEDVVAEESRAELSSMVCLFLLRSLVFFTFGCFSLRGVY